MISTRIVKINPLKIQEDFIREAGQVIKTGGLAIIPTETVYGLAANLLDDKAVERLRKIKNRPKDKYFSIVIDNKDRVEEFAREAQPAAYKLIDKFWPGPLTLILKGINQPSVGLRMPDNEIALKIIAAAKVPIILPSANISGKPAPGDFEAAIKDLGGLVDFAVDAGALKLGVESTIVDLTAEMPKIVRLGAINDEEINKTIRRKSILFICTGNTCRSVIAEALFKKMMFEHKRDDVDVFSAGIMAGSGVGASQGAREVLARAGINVSRHISREVTKDLAQRSDLILIMERLHESAILKIAPQVKNRVFLLKEFANPVRNNNNLVAKISNGAKIDENNLDIADPSGQPLGYYEDVYASIKEALERVSKLI